MLKQHKETEAQLEQAQQELQQQRQETEAQLEQAQQQLQLQRQEAAQEREDHESQMIGLRETIRQVCRVLPLCS